MRNPRWRVGALMLVAVVACTAAIDLGAQHPYGYDRGQDVSPTFEGWQRNPDGSYNFYFGYLNRNAAEHLDVPVGPDNAVDGGGDRGQPTHFYPGRRWWAFTVVVPGTWSKEQRLVWTVKSRGRTNQAKAWLQPEWEIDSALIIANARDPFLFRSGGDDRGADAANAAPAVSGPPTAAVALPQTARLAVTLTDDGRPLPPAEARSGESRRPAHGLRVRWIQYRGVGTVRFEPETSGPSAATPFKAETSVAFSAPGVYRLRAIATDGQLFSTHDIDVTVSAP